jgi:hypothetical protein
MLRHDADIGDSGLLHRVHDRSEGSEGDAFIGLEINNLV